MVGTRKAMPVSLPLSAGSTLPTALAAPVEEGMMLAAAAAPKSQSDKVSYHHGWSLAGNIYQVCILTTLEMLVV
jgi:hypothetical protein